MGEKKMIPFVREVRRMASRSTVHAAADRGLPDYMSYTLSLKQYVLAVTLGVSMMGLVGYLFYQHWLGVCIIGSAGFAYPKMRRTSLLERRRSQLTIQFKQALYAISSSLSAGRSLENAFKEAIADLQLLYPGTDVDVIRELRIIRSRVDNGEPMETAVLDFSRRAKQDDISSFADVLVTCKRMGGDVIEVVRRTASVISEKMEIVQEIDVLIAQKRLEMKAMMVAPFLFIAFMNVTAPDFMMMLYSGVGRLIATAAFLLLLAALWLMKRMMNIRV
ncbi:type II secretion system F family protein [Paenibacillus marinisediminis]